MYAFAAALPLTSRAGRLDGEARLLEEDERFFGFLAPTVAEAVLRPFDARFRELERITPRNADEIRVLTACVC